MFRPIQTHAFRWSVLFLNGLLLLGVHAETAIAPPAATSSESLPPAGQVLTRILVRAALERENDQMFEKHYYYKRTKKTDTRDKKDEPARSVVIESINDPIKTAATEDENAKDPQAKKRAYNRKDFKLDRALLDRFDFTVVQREIVRGRQTLVMDFAPAKKKLPSKDLKDRFINRTAGRVWIDEEEAAVVKLETRLIDNISFAAGLVGNVKSCTFSFERTRSPEGWWWTSAAEWHLEGRKLFSPIYMDFEEKATEVEKVR